MNILLAALLSFFSLNLIAEEATEAKDKEFKGTAELGYIANTGNSKVESFGAGTELDYYIFSWDHKFKANYIRSAIGDLTTSRIMSSTVRSTKNFTKRLGAFAELNYFQNRFAGIFNRYTADLGPSYKVLNTIKHKLNFDIAPGYVFEERNDVDAQGNTARISNDFFSGKTQIAYKWKISETSTLGEDIIYTRNFEDSDDWRLTNIFSLTTSISSIFSLKTSHTLIRLNKPAYGLTPTDTITSIALVANF